jgi:hypothetical protein
VFVPDGLDVRDCKAKPVTVQHVTVTTDNVPEVHAWITGNRHDANLGNGQLTIQTLEGPMTVRPGDEVLRGVQGEFTRCDPDIFKESYDDLGSTPESA